MNKLFLPVCLIALTLSGCYYDNEQDLYPQQTSTTSTNNVVTYSNDIQPLIASKCASSSCHATNAQPPDLSNYDKLKANITRVKVRAIDQRTMPAAGPLSNTEIAKIQSWIDAGTPNN
jgi:hypothetical protein